MKIDKFESGSKDSILGYFKLIIVAILFINSSVSNSQNIFPYGVASGDPTKNSVIIWTAIDSNLIGKDHEIIWEISKEPSFQKIEQQGKKEISSENGYTFKIDVQNLTPNSWYYYRFKYKKIFSEIGRTKTAPNQANSARFAVVSCSNYQHGFFNVYDQITKDNDAELIIHLGDYIYENGNTLDKKNIKERKLEPPHEIITLRDYRQRYAHYRKDTNLKQLHQNFPFINIWDDHEISNNAYNKGALNHSETTEGKYLDRLKNAKRAFYEWLPIRDTKEKQLYRKFEYGNSINLFFLDTRIEGRDKQTNRKKKYINDSTRRLIGDDQFNWLKKELLKSKKDQWNIIAQQVMVAPFKIAGLVVNTDQWDGYSFEKQRFFNFLDSAQINNLLILTGDLHSGWINNLPDKKNHHKSIGTEFITPSISSARGIPLPSWMIKLFNNHVRYLNLTKHGYISITFYNKKANAEFRLIDHVKSKKYVRVKGKSFTIEKNQTKIKREKNTIGFVNTNPPIVGY